MCNQNKQIINIEEFVNEEYNQASADYDTKWKHYTERTVQAFLKRLEQYNYVPNHGNEMVIVDVGCGTGALTLELAKQYPQAKQIIGVDLSTGMISKAQQNLHAWKEQNNKEKGDKERTVQIEFIVGNVKQVHELISTPVDLVLTLSSFHFWSDLEESLVSIRRLLAQPPLNSGKNINHSSNKKERTFIIMDWAHDYISCKLLGFWLSLKGYHSSKIFTQREVMEFMENAGFVLKEKDDKTKNALFRLGLWWGCLWVSGVVPIQEKD